MTFHTGALDLSDAAITSGWYTKAGVRAVSRRLGEDHEIEDAKLFFPNALIPHMQHEALSTLDPDQRRYLNAQHLYQWLEFTTHFEVAVVNRSCQRIAEGTAGLEVPVESRMAAFQIYIDEGYHSLYNLDVRLQLERASGIPALPFEFGPFLRQLDAVGDDLPQLRLLIQLLQVIVFETLITSLLAEIPKDQNIKTLVRDTVRDHAVDEGRHHRYFANLFGKLWQQLDPTVRITVAPFLPELIVRSLRPSLRSHRSALRHIGVPDALVADILAESYSPAATLDYIRDASARTVALFTRCGVLEVPGAADAFHHFGLLNH
jgi:hypothetical protein